MYFIIEKMSERRLKKLLVITPTPTHPQNAGNRARIFNLLKAIQDRGVEVHVLYDGSELGSDHVKRAADIAAMRKYWDGFYYVPTEFSVKFWLWGSHRSLWFQRMLYRLVEFVGNHEGLWTRIRRAPERTLGKMGRFLFRISPKFYGLLKPLAPDGMFSPKARAATHRKTPPQSIDSRYPHALDLFLPKLLQVESFDSVMVEYVFLSKALLHFDESVYKIIDTHDVFAERREGYQNAGIRDSFFSTSQEEEKEGLARADVIVAIQDSEAGYFESLLDRRILTIGHPVETVKTYSKRHPHPRLLFLGAANPANIHGIEKFCETVLPHLRDTFPELQLIVAGKVSDHINPGPGIELRGEVADLKELYQYVDIVINPTELGTGLKIKSIEALGRGKPLVATSHATEGMGSAKGFMRADSPDEMIEALTMILKDDDLHKRMSKDALDMAHHYNQTVKQAIDQLLNSSIDPKKARPPRRTKKMKRPFVIFTWARTGSSSLCRILNQYDDIRIKEEPFNHKIGVKLAPNDMVGLDRVLNTLWTSHSGVKHNWGLSRRQNIHLLMNSDVEVVFLWRRDSLARELSLYLSQQTGRWGAFGKDRDHILAGTYEPIDIEILERRMVAHSIEVEGYRRLLMKSGRDYFEISYEELYDPETTLETKHRVVNTLVKFLGRDTSLGDEQLNKVLQTLDPAKTKLNSEDSYRRIPNYETIRAHFGRLHYDSASQ